MSPQIKSCSELLKKLWIPTTWWWRTIKDAAGDGAFWCFSVLNQAPIRKLINNTYLWLTQPLRIWYSVAFVLFCFFSMWLYKLFFSVMLIMGRFSACQEAFEPTVPNARYGKYHFAGFFCALFDKNTVDGHNFHRQQRFFNLCVIRLFSHPSFLKMNKTAYHQWAFHFVADIFVCILRRGEFKVLIYHLISPYKLCIEGLKGKCDKM